MTGTLDPGALMGEPVGMASTDLLDTRAVAELAGVEVETIRMHMFRHTMPEPDFRIGASPAWKRKTIEKWLATRRKPGEKPPRKGKK